MATTQQIELAKKYYTQEQINQELANPWSVKRSAVIGTPTYEQPVNGQFASASTAPTTPAPKIPDVWQQSNWVNAQGETIYNFWTITTPRQTPTVPPWTPTIPNAPVPWSVSSILGEWFWAEDPFITQYTQDQLNQYNQVIDETAIRKQKESELQAQIDAINAVYADRLRQEQTKWQGRLGSGRALQARSGLLNSDFGTAQTENISQLNREQEQSVENERLALVNQLLSGAQKSAADEIAAKRLAKEAGGKAYLDYLAWADTRKKEKVSKAAQLLLSLGKSPQDISDEELKQAGISRQDLTVEYTAGKSAQEAAQSKLQAEQEKAALEALKTQSEIDKNQADIINEALKTGRVYEQGGFIFDWATNQLIGNAQAVTRARGGGGGRWTGGWVLGGYINPTGKSALDLQQVELPAKATEFSKKSYGFGVRMAEAEDSIKAIEDLYKTSGTTSEFISTILPSFLQSAERQKFEQAKRNFVNSVLRNESGAVIAESEFKNADKQYFPQPWDTPEVLEQKRRNRETAASNMFSSAGKDAYGNNIKDIYNAVKQQNTATTPSTPSAPSEDAYALYLKSIWQ